MTRYEDAARLLERSMWFFETALMQVGRGFYDLAVFSLEQSLQLYLKACLLRLGIDYPRTHSVRKPLELIRDVTGHRDIEEILSRYAVELGSLEDAYITSRYVTRTYAAVEVEKLKNTVEEVRNVVGRILG
ncbi:HEPN domain-containing protein [Candidatus Caldarchaeum subterraneum]|uniref:HEPN domain-containing protein n=1 Tax=Caldiarchaeum subterraneum TaxID=311458 RepID=E6N6V8_CALS0|nr:HEPN domain-containing protein [Candidatus Caldarchaeum subterraneum]BAJ49543.1 HEPN domain-containing protein [Candidatus Caldarchaeum subterraneum]BAJ50827.1 HEPN domain-containing protein [Candidatus Caldarchaeum subterraneum]